MDDNGTSRDSRQASSSTSTAGFAALALLLGAIGFGPLFSDSSTIIGTGLFFFASGLFIGYCHPSRWWIAGLTTWGGAWLAGTALIGAIHFRDAAILNVTVAEGQVIIAPEVIAAGKIGIRMTNRGTAPHFLGASRLDGVAAPERMQKIDVTNFPMTFTRLSPGKVVTLYFGGVAPGRYMLSCLEVTATDIPHRELGETAEFRIE